MENFQKIWQVDRFSFSVPYCMKINSARYLFINKVFLEKMSYLP